jgi:hypothetical protein
MSPSNPEKMNFQQPFKNGIKMITTTASFIKGQSGKALLYALMVSILYMGYGCVAYRQVPMAKEDFLANEQIQRYLDQYSIYIHEGGATFRMEDVQLIDGRDLSGRLVAATYALPSETAKRAEKKAWWKAHKYDIHIYTHDNMNLTASSGAGLSLMEGRVVVNDQMIKEVQVMGIDVKKSISTGVIVLIVVAGLIIAPLLLAVSIIASVESGASDSDSDSDSDSGDSGSGDSGSSDSGGSDSGSSDSGGSDSGGSDSGGSDSGGSDSGGSDSGS